MKLYWIRNCFRLYRNVLFNFKPKNIFCGWPNPEGKLFLPNSSPLASMDQPFHWNLVRNLTNLLMQFWIWSSLELSSTETYMYYISVLGDMQHKFTDLLAIRFQSCFPIPSDNTKIPPNHIQKSMNKLFLTVASAPTQPTDAINWAEEPVKTINENEKQSDKMRSWHFRLPKKNIFWQVKASDLTTIEEFFAGNVYNLGEDNNAGRAMSMD